MFYVKFQTSNVKCQISNVNKVKLLSERFSGVPPVIFTSGCNLFWRNYMCWGAEGSGDVPLKGISILILLTPEAQPSYFDHISHNFKKRESGRIGPQLRAYIGVMLAVLARGTIWSDEIVPKNKIAVVSICIWKKLQYLSSLSFFKFHPARKGSSQ